MRAVAAALLALASALRPVHAAAQPAAPPAAGQFFTTSDGVRLHYLENDMRDVVASIDDEADRFNRRVEAFLDAIATRAPERR